MRIAKFALALTVAVGTFVAVMLMKPPVTAARENANIDTLALTIAADLKTTASCFDCN
jgi:hypothetical protein